MMQKIKRAWLRFVLAAAVAGFSAIIAVAFLALFSVAIGAAGVGWILWKNRKGLA